MAAGKFSKAQLIAVCESKLDRHVANWLSRNKADYEDGVKGVIDDLMRGGCESGYVGHLIYYHDTTAFYRRYRTEINALLTELLNDTGSAIGEFFGKKWDDADPLALDDMNQNLLAWFGFEETARNIALRLKLDV
jgi:methionyl-tRNA synthetase